MPVTASVVIIGGGPAGGAIALELARAGCDVVLLERQQESGWKIGETLPPEARIHLHRLGHWQRFQESGHLPCHGVVSVWGDPVPIEKDFIFTPHGHGWQLDRARFESTLLGAAIEAGCRVHFGVSVERMEAHRSDWLIQATTNDFRAPWLVDCTGRRGLVIRREGGGYEQTDQLVSLYATATTSKRTDSDSRTYVESHPEGWCYTAQMPNGSRIVAFQTDRDLLPDRLPTSAWLWSQLTACSTIDRLLKQHGYEFVESPHLVAAHSGRFSRCVGQNWVAVGDAAMTFDPISGQGSAKALESASRAVRAILHEEDYQATCDALWTSYLREHLECYRAERRWSESPFWSRRHVS
jgi:flavin-dependent dehydrogenase